MCLENLREFSNILPNVNDLIFSNNRFPFSVFHKLLPCLKVSFHARSDPDWQLRIVSYEAHRHTVEITFLSAVEVR